MNFQRYAVYFTPADGPLARFGASWLGWDIAGGCTVAHPRTPGFALDMDTITRTPRKYGFHATIKPPFRLAGGTNSDDLAAALERLADQMPPIPLAGLEVAPLGRFLALVVTGEQAQVNGLAAMVVETLDAFRAPATEAELAKRRAPGLTRRQNALLARWGYPYVLDAFRFHMTLTGKLPKSELATVRAALDDLLRPADLAPFVFDGLSLVGEAEDGRFRLIHRYALSL